MNKLRYGWILLAIFFCQNRSGAQNAAGVTAWLNIHSLQNGAKLKPDASIDIQEFTKQYKANKSLWDKAFAYLKTADLEKLSPGKFYIDGDNITATVSDGTTRPIEKARWEAHHNVVDIHLVIKGKENIGIGPVEGAAVVQAYIPERDVGFYNATGKFYLAEPGTFFIISPKEAHSPSMRAEGSDTSRKIVIKVKYVPETR